MPETRVFGSCVDIDQDAVRDFFAGRARRTTGDHPLTSVLYQDSRPELAEERDRFERELVMPMLRLDRSTDVLDVGCGIGRWAGPIVGVARGYVGVDFSAELLEVARRDHQDPSAQFVHLSADRLDLPALGRDSGFERVLLAGVLLYLNDDQVQDVARGLVAVAGPGCRMVIREPMAIGQRLTLRDHWSQELGQTYHAVYRTQDELMGLLMPQLAAAGFVCTQSGDMYPDALNNRAETRQRYLVLERDR